jgi:hypothetical protein
VKGIFLIIGKRYRHVIKKFYEPGFSLLLLLFGWRRAVRLR